MCCNFSTIVKLTSFKFLNCFARGHQQHGGIHTAIDVAIILPFEVSLVVTDCGSAPLLTSPPSLPPSPPSTWGRRSTYSYQQHLIRNEVTTWWQLLNLGGLFCIFMANICSASVFNVLHFRCRYVVFKRVKPSGRKRLKDLSRSHVKFILNVIHSKRLPNASFYASETGSVYS